MKTRGSMQSLRTGENDKSRGSSTETGRAAEDIYLEGQ